MAVALHPEGRQRWPLAHRPPSDLAATLARGERLVSNRTGLIHAVTETPARPGEPPLFQFSAEVGATEVWAGHGVVDGGNGCGFARAPARMAAIGEAVERYSSGLLGRREALIRASYAQVRDAAIDPRGLPLGSAREYAHPECPVVPYQDDLTIDWVWSYSLTARRHVLVPAGAVFLPHLPPTPHERLLIEITNGLSCGATREEALLGALLELLERDAFVICWLNRLPTLTVDSGPWLSPPLERALTCYERMRARLVLKLLPTEHGVPIVIAMLEDESGDGPAFTMGACASLDPARAIHKALAEMEQCRRWLAWLRDAGAGAALDPAAPDAIQTREQHMGLYTRHDALPQVRFLLDDHGPARLAAGPAGGDPLAALETIVARLAALGLEVLAVEVTARDITQVGLHVVRVIVPGLQPLYFGNRMRHLAGARLYDTPRRLGLRPTATTEDELNPLPHPFP